MPASPVRCTTILTLLLACGNPAIAQTSTPSSSSPTEGRSEQYNVPPPPGYKPPPGRFVQSDREREEDDRYSREADGGRQKTVLPIAEATSLQAR